MNVAEQVKKWRANQKQRSGGMKQMTTWVTKRDSALLRKVFDLLADPESGTHYRANVVHWLFRRRPVQSITDGASWHLEIDGPSVGHSGFNLPMGGRIIGPFETWVELTPEEAKEAEKVLWQAVDAALESYAREKKWLGRIIDKTGVATNVAFEDQNYPASRDDIFLRPEDAEAFRKNEERIQRHILRQADAYVAKWEAPKYGESLERIFEFDAHNSIMSRCHLFEGRHKGHKFIAFGHIKGSLASPTNNIEELASLAWRDKAPNENPADIIWFDCMPGVFGSRSPKITQVKFKSMEKGRFDSPIWEKPDPENIPPILIDEMLPLLRKSERHPYYTAPEVHETLAILWQMQPRHGILQFCSSECPMDELKTALLSGGKIGLRDYLKNKTRSKNTHYVEAYDFDIWPEVYEAMHDIGLQMITLEQADFYDGREGTIR